MNDRTLELRSFGAVPDSGLDAGPAFRAALAAARGRDGITLTLEPGRYDFFSEGCSRRPWEMSNSDRLPTRSIAVLIEGMRDFTLDGGGAELVCHAPMTAIGADRCEGLSIRNLSLDFSPPLNADALVLSASPWLVRLGIDAAVHPHSVRGGSLRFTGRGWSHRWKGELMEFDPRSGLIPEGTGDLTMVPGRYACLASSPEPGLVELRGVFGRPPRPGNVLVLRHGARSHAGILVDGSSSIVLSRLRIHSTAGLGVLFQHSRDISVEAVDSIPAPGRVMAGHDDGIHVSNCKGLVRIAACRFAGLMDDPVNIHGTSARITARRGSTIAARFMHPQSRVQPFAETGDLVGLIRAKTMETLGQARVAAFRRVGEAGFELDLEGVPPPGIGSGDALENLSWAPEVEIRDCEFRQCRARGLLVSTPGRTLVENNLFESSGSAILVAGDANYWYESGAVRDLTIRGNRFSEHCLTSFYQFCEGVISIRPTVPRPGRPFHRNITVEGNSFACFGHPAIHAFSAEGLAIRGNAFAASAAHEPRHRRGALISLEACRGVDVSANAADASIPRRTIDLDAMDPAELRLEDGQGLRLGRTRRPRKQGSPGKEKPDAEPRGQGGDEG